MKDDYTNSSHHLTYYFLNLGVKGLKAVSKSQP